MSVGEETYARYGVTRGYVDFGASRATTVVVIAHGWPSWAFACEAAGLKLLKVVLLEDRWKVWCIKILGKDLVCSYEDLVRDVGFVIQAEVFVSDIDLPARVNLWRRVKSIFICRRAVRRVKEVPEAFKHLRLDWSHVKSGGVTDGEWVLTFYLNESVAWYPGLLPVSSKQDLSSLVNSTAGYGLECPRPNALNSREPKVVLIRPKTYHGGGLYPFKDRTAYFVVPSVFTKSKWCRRRFSAEETLSSLDVSVDFIKQLSSSDRAALCNDMTFVPSKTCIQILRSVWEALDIRVPIDRTEAANAACSRQHTAEVIAEKLPLQNIDNDSERSKVEALSSTSAFDEISRAARIQKATKADDAEVPYYLWNDRIFLEMTDRQISALDVMRQWFHRMWCKKILREFKEWFRNEHHQSITDRPLSASAKVDLVAGRDCIGRCCDSDWWEWKRGTRPHFWRWPSDYRANIRDGIKLWLKGPVTRWRVPQRPERDELMFNGMRKKLTVPREKGYIERGEVYSLTSFFAVKKGETDIRMVYDGTKSGFNGTCWAPWFMLPTIEQHIRATLPGSFMGDLDVGEMFLNFVLNESVRKYCGVDLTTIFTEEVKPGEVLWERWGRCGMGFTFSPYQAVQGMLRGEEFILGDRHDQANPFRWEVVRLNLPGMEDYDPSIPWVCKIRANGDLASELLIYVDDLRIIANTNLECWQASHWVASRLNYLGLQDAARKRRGPEQEPGAWAGSIVHSTMNRVTVLISLERWIKTKAIVAWIINELESHEKDGLEHKQLEKHRGVLVYISRTYPALVPYLKGIHLTLDGWRPWRNTEGWRMTSNEMRAYQIEKGWDELGVPQDKGVRKPPRRVKPVPRLHADVKALEFLTSGDTPPKRLVRPTGSSVALYGFADASGHGFGSTLVIGGRVHFRHGQWSSDYNDESSNFRELDNLVTAIEEAHREGLLDNAELFMFTDNSTAESAFYKGTSSVVHLFNLVLRLRKMQMAGEFMLHVIHCAGTRMIAEGTDGLSRADLSEGVMKGKSIMSFVPLHESALNRAPMIKDWVQKWMGAESFNWLTPDQWFTEGQTETNCIWTPPPAAADVAIECLAKSKHKRPYNEHVVLIPRLMTSRWRRLLNKVCDLTFTVPVGTDVWSYSQHEPLIVGIALPLISHRPWRLRGAKTMVQAESDLRHLPLSTPEWGGAVLRQLCAQSRLLDKMPEGVVWSLLQGDASN